MWVGRLAATGPVFPSGRLAVGMAPRVPVAILLSLVSLGLAGCVETEYSAEPGPDDTGIDSDTDKVTLRDDTFSPSQVTADVGDTVRFVNDGSRLHTVTVVIAGDDNIRKDTELEPGQETSMSIDRQTDYTVYCRYHGSPDGGMRMIVAAS
ncbi:MAG: cupredoxin domain-containing protein [Euryarchaeota archaeon]|nr:cupredoxin domain-containing protein [Euryarchaeota archaeon]